MRGIARARMRERHHGHRILGRTSQRGFDGRRLNGRVHGRGERVDEDPTEKDVRALSRALTKTLAKTVADKIMEGFTQK